MNDVLRRLRDDHALILSTMDDIERTAESLEAGGLARLIARIWDLVTVIERHEEYEEERLLLPLSETFTDLESLRTLNHVRHDHGDLFDRLSALQNRLGALRGLPASEWTPDRKADVRRNIHDVFRSVRGHIQRENMGVFFLADRVARGSHPTESAGKPGGSAGP